MSKLDVGTLGEYIREQRNAAQMSLRQLAKSAGVSNPYLSQVERGLRKPSAEILTQIAAALRISAETLYVRAGLLESHDASLVRTAIARDPSLTERQRRAMFEIYSAFVAENTQAAPESSGGITDSQGTAAEHDPVTGGSSDHSLMETAPATTDASANTTT